MHILEKIAVRFPDLLFYFNDVDLTVASNKSE